MKNMGKRFFDNWEASESVNDADRETDRDEFYDHDNSIALAATIAIGIMIIVVAMLLFKSVASAAELEPDGDMTVNSTDAATAESETAVDFEWPRGCYYNPYGSIAELPTVVHGRVIGDDSAEAAFNAATYFRVTEADLAKPGIVKVGSTDDDTDWAICVSPQLCNADALNAYCSEYGITTMLIRHNADHERALLIGIDRSRLDEFKASIGGQTALGDHLVFEIQLTGQPVNDSTKKLALRNRREFVGRVLNGFTANTQPIKAETWIVDNLGSAAAPIDGYGFIVENGTKSKGGPAYFTADSMTLSPQIQDAAIDAIEQYLELSSIEP
ncbi:hypothetical protein IKD60_02950 [Candidatus Saccharibacteria bacterium]|nr:hypothetical protein [Candidatus Saccharibacteria bacterium]